MSEDRHILCSPRQYGDLPPTAVSHLQKHSGLRYHGRDFLYSVLPCRADTPELPVSWPAGFKTVLCTTTWLLDCRHLMVLGGELTALCSGQHKATLKKKKVPSRQKGIVSEKLDLHHTADSLRA